MLALPGVYFLLDSDGVCAYVGQSSTVWSRLQTHVSNGVGRSPDRFYPSKAFALFNKNFVNAPFRCFVESACILYFAPRENKRVEGTFEGVDKVVRAYLSPAEICLLRGLS